MCAFRSMVFFSGGGGGAGMGGRIRVSKCFVGCAPLNMLVIVLPRCPEI